MKLTKDTLDKIQQQVDIVEVIGDFVSLKKKGHYYSACCPFHNEKTPSFAVTPAKGIYKCFGCGKGGDAIQFVMEIEGINYIEAMKYLAKKYGIEVSEEGPTADEIKQQSERDSLFIVLNYAKNFYQNLLLENEEGQAIGYSYFKERGFSEGTIRKFELGYALNEWDALLKDALKGNYQLSVLEKAGLVIARENANDSKTSKHYDRFRGRVIFPIHNVSGKVIAFGARILKADKNQPKYINSPETEVYHKSKILYGISQAKNAIRNEDNCYLVEGYTDVISLHQAGIENVVASSGTSLTQEQIRLIKRYTNNITVLYDGDPAGIRASIRGIDLILEEDMNVNVVTFPDNDDPDSYVRKIGGTEFTKYIKASKKDFITFKTELFLKDAGNDPLKKAEVIKEIVASISKIPDRIKRDVFVKQCSTTLGIDEGTLFRELNQIYLKQKHSTPKPQQQDDGPPEDLFADPVVQEVIKEQRDEKAVIKFQEKEIVRLLINFGAKSVGDDVKLAEFLLNEIEDIDILDPVYNRFVEAIKASLQQGVIPNEEFFLRNEDEIIRKNAVDLMAYRYELSPNWAEMHNVIIPGNEELLDVMVNTTVLRLKWRNIQGMIKDNMDQMMNSKDDEEIIACQKIHIQLKEMEKALAKLLGNVIAK